MGPPGGSEAKRLSPDTVSFFRCLGFEGSRRNNLVYIAANTLIHTCGNSVQFLDLETKSQINLLSVGGFGIGCVAVHPSRDFFAVCEKGNHPNVYIYNYPSLTVHKILKQGTEKMYTAAAFNFDGSQLATVGGPPDFWLTVWDWRFESIVLQSKAFSQDIFQVSFSRHFSGQLVTCGIGHIRFWNMANTFTGPKLEGLIGKFGQVPLSDICAFAELPDGKVLSGTESGTVLVWDGGLIKCQLRRPGGSPCHDGMIEFLQLEGKGNEMLTAGADGYVRFWSLQWLDAAHDGDEKTVCEINPLRELHVDEKCSIKGIIVTDDHWLIQDENGILWKVHIPTFEVEKVLEFHAGFITGLSVSPNNHFLATSGSDCSVRLFHFKEKQQIYARWFTSGATTILWPSKTVDPDCRTIVAGFTDGVIRVLSRGAHQWGLTHAQKPHTMDVTAVSYSSDGDILATSSLDATVFFFHSSNRYKPLGFVKAPGPVTCIDWSPNGMNLLVGCSNGKILEIARPGYEVDSSITFELSLPSKSYTFLLPDLKDITQQLPEGAETKGHDSHASDKPDIGEHDSQKTDVEGRSVQGSQAEMDGDNQIDSKEINDHTQENESDFQSRHGSMTQEVKEEDNEMHQSSMNITDVANEDVNTAKGQQEQLDSKETSSLLNQQMSKEVRKSVHEFVQESNPIRSLLYTNSNLNTFYMVVEGAGAGCLFECHIDMKEVMGVTRWHSVPIKCLQYSSSQQYIVSGHDDGSVRIQTAPTPGQLSVMQQHVFWEGRLHDGFIGVVAGAMISCDHCFLASAAYDGSFYVHELKLEKPQQFTIHLEADKPSEAKDTVVDIGVGVYSIEEDKQKTEQDKQLKIALHNKKKLKDKVEAIQNSISKLLKENNERDINERLPLEDFEVDPSIRSMIESEIESRISEVKQELQWESEKMSIALGKLKRLFLDSLEVELIVLHGFKTNACVTTFRTGKLDPEILTAINEANSQRELPPAPRVSVLTLLKDAEEFPKGKNVAQIDDENSEHHAKAEDSAALQDMRRRRLKKMVSDYEKYVNDRENKNFESEDDIAAIKYAENNMGDFKLKTDLEHVQPKNQQTNAKKKRNEMLLLKESIFNQKMEFNREFLALRDIKMQISKQIHEKNCKIQEINDILRIKDEPLFAPCIFKDETPEERDKVSDKDIEEHCQNLKKMDEMHKAQEKKGGLDFGGMVSKAKPEEKNTSLPPSEKKALIDDSSRKEFEKLHRAHATTQSRAFALSSLEQEEQDATHIKLKFQKSKLLENIENMVNNFDNALKELRHKRFQLEINIKRADLKMITLYQELKVLRTMQPKEEALESRHSAKQMELRDMSDKLSEQDKVLEQKKQEVQALKEKKKQLMEEFEELVGESHPAKDALLKIYMRRIKLSKGVDDEDDDNLDEDMEVDDSKGSEDDFDEDEVVEICPAGCDQELYEKVCQLRERRTIEDSLLQESNKHLDVAQREKESKLKKKKAIETALASLEKEMEDFQKEKQNSLNQIDAVLPLYMHQLENLPDGKLPDDLSGVLVFSNKVINQLKETIKDHNTETVALKKLQKELKKEHITLVRERKSRESKIEDLEQRVIDVQMLKFGQMIDLEVLDTMNAKKDNEELRLQLRTQEAQNAAEVSKWNRLIDNSIDQIARAMKEHAACLHVTADLQESIRLLNKNMQQKAGSTYRDVFVEKKKAELEYNHLSKVVAAQGNRIEILNQELLSIQNDRRKLFP